MRRRRRSKSTNGNAICYCENGKFAMFLWLPSKTSITTLAKYGFEPLNKRRFQMNAFVKCDTIIKLEQAVTNLYKEVYGVTLMSLFNSKNKSFLFKDYEDTPLPRRK